MSVQTCARCGHELGIGRFCTNCGHRVGAPVPVEQAPPPAPAPPAPPAHATGPATGRATAGAPRPGPALRVPGWAPWLVGVLVLVLALWLLASSLRDDDADRAGDAARERTGQPSGAGGAATDPGTDADSGAGSRPVDVARFARVEVPVEAPPTTDLDGDLVAYTGRQLSDGVAQTCWRMPGDGTGQTITLRLAESTALTRVGLVNGYAKRVSSGGALVDWYPNNRRITSVEWVFDDGTVVPQTLREVPRMQRLPLSEAVTTSTVRLRILSVTPPAAGPLGRDYTAISDVLLVGAPA